MNIIYDSGKADKLLKERGICLEEISGLLAAGEILGTIKNPARPGQRVFLLMYKGYVHAVPYINDEKGNYIIKTAYRTRKYNKIFGGLK